MTQIEALVITVVVSNLTSVAIVMFGLHVRNQMVVLKEGIDKGMLLMVGMARLTGYQRGWEDAEREKQALLREIKEVSKTEAPSG